MTTALYRAFCPDTVELGEYHLDLIPGDRRLHLAQHVAECPHCRREIAQLDQFLTSTAPDIEFSPVERIKVWVARLVPSGFNTRMALAPALAVRGAGAGPQLYEAGDAQISIEIQPDTRPGTYALVGLVTGVALNGLQATLWRDEKAMTTTEVDDLGNLVFGDLRSGRYLLALQGPALEIELQDLEIGG